MITDTLRQEVLALKDPKDISEVYRLLRIQSDHLGRLNASSLRVGDLVKFSARGGGEISGKITKFNRTTVDIAPADGNIARWRVYPQHLRKA